MLLFSPGTWTLGSFFLIYKNKKRFMRSPCCLCIHLCLFIYLYIPPNFWSVWDHLTVEELLKEKVAAPVYKTEINGRGDSLHWPRNTLYPKRLALSSPTSGGLSVGIVRLRNTATEYSFLWDHLALCVSLCLCIPIFSFSMQFMSYERKISNTRNINIRGVFEIIRNPCNTSVSSKPHRCN
jgi:hypothetical protein